MTHNFMDSQNNMDELLFCFSAMAGEFPGAKSIEELWDFLNKRKPAATNSLLPRWDVESKSIFNAHPGTLNKVYLDKAFTLDEPIGDLSRQLTIGTRVLQQLFKEPQLNSNSLQRSRIGLILATSWSDESYFASDNGLSAGEQVQTLADRMQLGGPALSVDTACSSLHYALEMGRSLVISGQADQVVIMTINTVLALPLYLGFSQLTAFSEDACLRAFGSQANGIVPAECACAFLLEPLNSALISRRTPLGLLKAIGLSSDGNEGSTFSPSENAQIAAYQRAWKNLDPKSIDYLETHGTGTPLGDKTELQSIHQFFVKSRTNQSPLLLGSIKAMLGHTLAAAGGPSLAKALMILKNQYIPPQPDYQVTPSLSKIGIELATSNKVDGKKVRRIGISSFGFGGSNAHMIIDKPLTYSKEEIEEPIKNNGLLRLNLSIIDAEAALGGAFHLAEWRDALKCPNPIGAFPIERFENNNCNNLKHGHYLNKDYEIDVNGYSMGPKALNHIDPYKLLLSSLAGRIINRHPSVANNTKTAVMICCNTGGESFSNAYSRCEYFKSGQGNPPNVTVADVASMLPSMLSGYVAKIFNLQGFHQTLAGKPGLLWQALLTLPTWFNRGFDQIILGAGRYISSYSELRHCDDATKILHGEGAGVLLIKPWDKNDDQSLVLLHCAVFATHASQLSDACDISGIDQSEITEISICELDAFHQENTQNLYQSTGWLSEACGIEYLLRQVVSLKGKGVIEVHNQGNPVMWLFSERLKNLSDSANHNNKLPYVLKFSGSTQTTVNGIQHIQTIESNIDKSNTCLQLISQQVSETVLAGLSTRNLIMQNLSTGDIEQNDLEKNLSNLITNIQLTEYGWGAILNVNQEHPYFFDHPLDHVPGILLIAGALQLIDYAKIIKKSEFISSINIRFMNYVNLNSKINLKLYKSKKQDWTVIIEQHQKVVCSLKFTYSHISLADYPKNTNRFKPCTRMELLHKHNEDNVLVSDLFVQEDIYSVFTTPIPDNHFFQHSGSTEYLSIVYFLEIARQCYMQIAHEILKVPLGIPMNLVILDFSLEAPISREGTLRVTATKENLPKTSSLNNIIKLSLFSSNKRIGSVKIIAQVLKK